jgi:hypothetical protein
MKRTIITAGKREAAWAEREAQRMATVEEASAFLRITVGRKEEPAWYANLMPNTMSLFLSHFKLALGDDVIYKEFSNIRLRVTGAYSTVGDTRKLSMPAARVNAECHVRCVAYEIESQPVRFLSATDLRKR